MKPSNFIKSSEKSILTEDVATCTKQVATSVEPSTERSKYSILDTAKTGFGEESPTKNCTKQITTSINSSIIRSKYSILDTAKTGFGEENKLIKNCPKPEYKTYLFRENYLGEFKTETEKTLARNNLEVYSK
jgi:hypothetical protein